MKEMLQKMGMNINENKANVSDFERKQTTEQSKLDGMNL